MSMSKSVYQCDFCPHQIPNRHKLKHNSSRTNLFEHFLRRHAHIPDADKLTCDHCGHAVFHSHELWHHIFYKHFGQLSAEMLVCEECGRRFCKVFSLYKHFSAQHTAREKPFACADCNHSTCSKSHLCSHIVHQHIITGQFKCDLCQKRLKSKGGLKRHRLTTHQGLQIQYECDMCGARISSSRKNLAYHLFRCTMYHKQHK